MESNIDMLTPMAVDDPSTGGNPRAAGQAEMRHMFIKAIRGIWGNGRPALRDSAWDTGFAITGLKGSRKEYRSKRVLRASPGYSTITPGSARVFDHKG